MKRVFRFKKGTETEDFGDTEMYHWLWNYLLEPSYNWLPRFKDDVKVTIIVERAR